MTAGTHPAPHSAPPPPIGVAQNVQPFAVPQVPIVPAVEMVQRPGQPVVLQATAMHSVPGVMVQPADPGQNAKQLL